MSWTISCFSRIFLGDKDLKDLHRIFGPPHDFRPFENEFESGEQITANESSKIEYFSHALQNAQVYMHGKIGYGPEKDYRLSLGPPKNSFAISAELWVLLGCSS